MADKFNPNDAVLVWTLNSRREPVPHLYAAGNYLDPRKEEPAHLQRLNVNPLLTLREAIAVHPAPKVPELT